MRSLGMGRALKPWLLVMLAQKQELFGCICSLLCGIIPCLLPIEQANKAFTPKHGVQFQDRVGAVRFEWCRQILNSPGLRPIEPQIAIAKRFQAENRIHRCRIAIKATAAIGFFIVGRFPSGGSFHLSLSGIMGSMAVHSSPCSIAPSRTPSSSCNNRRKHISQLATMRQQYHNRWSLR